MKKATRIFSYALIVAILILIVCFAVLFFGNIDKTVEGFGMISPARHVTVAPEIDGIVEKVHVLSGDEVSKSDTLFLIQSDALEFDVEQSIRSLAKVKSTLERTMEEYRNLTASRSYEIGVIFADLNEAEKRMNFQKVNFDRAKQLHDKGLIDKENFEREKLNYESSQSYYEVLRSRSRILKKQYERMIEDARMDLVIAEKASELARQKLKKTIILSPISGTILTHHPELLSGTLVNKGKPVIEIGDLSDLRFVININEININEIQVGQKAKIYLNSFPYRQYKVFEGEVEVISVIPQLIEGSATYEVKITITHPWTEKSGERINLKYGLRGRAEIITKPDIKLLEALLEGILE